MIKIIKKQVEEVVTKYDVELKVATLYEAYGGCENVIKFENCVFQNALPVGWNANEYLLKYEIDEGYTYVRVNITTGKVKDDSYTFFDYEQAVKIHTERRIKFLKDRIADLKEYKQELKRLKDKIDGLKKYQQELEELEND